MKRLPLIRLVSFVALGASGCQLIADFDRSKIPTDAGQLPDASFDEDAGGDDDGGFDATLPFDAGDDAATDAGNDAATDAGDDAATGDDAGTDDAG
jgi:hypothetical protein